VKSSGTPVRWESGGTSKAGKYRKHDSPRSNGQSVKKRGGHHRSGLNIARPLLTKKRGACTAEPAKHVLEKSFGGGYRKGRLLSHTKADHSFRVTKIAKNAGKENKPTTEREKSMLPPEEKRVRPKKAGGSKEDRMNPEVARTQKDT